MGQLCAGIVSKEVSMQQPKYKIGDKLRSKCGYEAKVKSISIREDGIQYYGGPAAIGIGMEENVELVQEPQKKKLYAYKFRDGVGYKIEFYLNELSGEFTPAPEYDIEYPIKVTEK